MSFLFNSLKSSSYGGSEVKASASNAGSIPGWGRSPGEGKGNPLQYSCLENPTDWGAWWATVYGVTKSQTRLNDFTSLHYPRTEAFILPTSGSVGNWRVCKPLQLHHSWTLSSTQSYFLQFSLGYWSHKLWVQISISDRFPREPHLRQVGTQTYIPIETSQWM